MHIFLTNGILDDGKMMQKNRNSDISVIEVNKSFTEITIETKRVNKPCEKMYKNRLAMKPITFIAAERRN